MGVGLGPALAAADVGARGQGGRLGAALAPPAYLPTDEVSTLRAR